MEKNKKDLLSLNIVLIPPKEVCAMAIAASQLISRKTPCFFALNNSNFFPHLTLYQIVIPAKNLNLLKSQLESILKKVQPAKFTITDIKAANRFIFASFDLNNEIKKTEDLVVDSLNSLREGNTVSEYWSKQYLNANFSDKEEENIKKYGYFLVKDSFDPHITITRVKNFNEAETMIKLIEWSVAEFTSSAIGIYILGDNGTCVKFIDQLALGRKD